MRRPTSLDTARAGELVAAFVEPILKQTVKDSVREVLREEGLTADFQDRSAEQPRPHEPDSGNPMVTKLVFFAVVVAVAYVASRKRDKVKEQLPAR